MADEKLTEGEVVAGLEGLDPDEVRRRLAATPDILAVFDRLRLGLPVRNPRETLAAIRTGLEFTLSKPATAVAVALVPAKVKNPFYVGPGQRAALGGEEPEFLQTLVLGEPGQEPPVIAFPNPDCGED